jgi:hypothetical protein
LNMTALAADRNTPKRDGVQFAYPAAADKVFYAGSLVVLDSSGNAEPGTTATGKICVGMCTEYLDTTGLAAAAVKVKVEAGCFLWGNGETITKAHIGDTAYILDDQTVYRTGTGKSAAGIIVDVETAGVWVHTSAPVVIASTGLTAANNLSDVGTVATARSNLGLDTADSPTFAAATITGAAAVGSLTSVGTTTGRQKWQDVAAGAYTVTTADGDIYIACGADNDVVTLPDAAAANKGMRVTVQNVGADGACLISISPHSSDGIRGGVHGAAGGDLVSFAGTHDKDAQNTKATAKEGDYLILISDGVDDWWVVGGKGVWATQA